MLQIREATTPADFNTIQNLAQRTWPHTFNEILSEKQIEYMLNWMYSPASLEEQVLEKGHRFLLAALQGTPVGFAGYELHYKQQPKTKIHKIYVLPDIQGSGAGKSLMNTVAALALQNEDTVLTLNVNRFNKAVRFYENFGFKITGEEDIDIGNGYLMEDFIMEKVLP